MMPLKLIVILTTLGFSAALDPSLCPSVDGPDSVYFPDRDCSVYWQCSNGVPVKHKCSADLHFNPVLNVCDYPERAGCGTPGTTTERPDNACLRANVTCDDECLEREYTPLSNCGEYCVCFGGVTEHVVCPDGLHFNALTHLCDLPENAGCQNPCTEGNVTCPLDQEEYVYSPLDNCGEYCRCRCGEVEHHVCDKNLHFNPKTNECDLPANAGCGNPCELANVTCPIDQEEFVYERLDNCGEYCSCSCGIVEHHVCDENLHFNLETEQCDLPANAGCGNPCELANVTCPIDQEEFVYERLDNCGEYCSCSCGIVEYHVCDENLHFNLETEQCDLPANAGCGNPCELANVTCPIDQEEFVYERLDNCGEYCSCSCGIVEYHVCDENLHFNLETEQCDLPANAGCGNPCELANVTCPIDQEEFVYERLDNCGEYCSCSCGIVEHHVCDENLHFNLETEQCDLPANAGCGNPCELANVTCPIDQEEFVYERLDNCGEYCSCSCGIVEHHVCDENLHFNLETEQCDLPANAGCGNPCELANVTCPIDQEEFIYERLDNCGEYCSCSCGIVEHHVCAENLHFNLETEQCDLPANAGCGNPCELANVTCPIDQEEFVYERLDNCGEYCSCSCGIVEHHVCEPNLHFNLDTKQCDLPENAGCGNPCKLANVTCPIDQEEFVYERLDNCGEYCSCSCGVVEHHVCAANLHFNLETKQCDLPANAGCGNPCELTNVTCPIDQEEFVYERLENCGEYCSCSCGIVEHHVCAPNLHFNLETEQCDLPANAGCGNPCELANVTCPIDQEEFVYERLDNCGEYCSCSCGIVEHHVCADNLHFNLETKQCDLPANAGCGNPCELANVTCPIDQEEFVFERLDNCGEYCSCSCGIVEHHVCADNLHFNLETKQCDLPANAGCGNPCELANVTCPIDQEEFVYERLDNCGEYCSCSCGVVEHHVCAANLHFNLETEQCDLPANAGCGNPCELANVTCPIDQEEFIYERLDNCGEYCTCSCGIVEHHVCAPNLHFNLETEQCDLPANAGCGNPCELANVTCPIDQEEFVYERLDNCGEYCSCSCGIVEHHACAENLHFNLETEQCDLSANAGCGNPCELANVTCPIDQEEFVYERLDNCGEYCSCSCGIVEHHVCAGNLHFNLETKQCDLPANAGCGNPCELANVTCLIDQEEFVYERLDNCGEYCSCSCGIVEHHVCAGNLHFNLETEQCDLPANAGCGNPCELANITCPVDQEEFIYERLDNCGEYCSCSCGVVEHHVCAENLHFNLETEQCDLPANAGCGNPCELANVTCPVDQEEYVYERLDNCGEYCSCSCGIVEHHVCAGNLHFNLETKQCDLPANAGCGNPCELANVTCPIDQEEFVYERLDNCGEYCSCSCGIVEHHVCAPNLHFNLETEQCDLPANAGCGNPCELANVTCPIDQEEFVYERLDNCGEYCSCSCGIVEHHVCAENLHFNLETEQCDLPANAGCGNPCELANVTCPTDQEDFVYERLDNCGEYCSCSCGIVEHHVCEPNLHFNLDTKQCDLPANAGCGNPCELANVTCPVDQEEYVYERLDNCGEYCSCSCGIVEHHVCAENLHFNLETEQCDLPANAGCGNPCELANVTCPIDQEEFVYERLDNCGEYCSCSCGIVEHHVCEDNLHFNPEINDCDFPENADCDSPCKPCDDCEGPIYTALGNCEEYCVCTNGVINRKKCDDLLVFNPITNLCDHRENVSTCRDIY